jgi:membrane-bound lytic murein transglycosylase B
MAFAAPKAGDIGLWQPSMLMAARSRGGGAGRRVPLLPFVLIGILLAGGIALVVVLPTLDLAGRRIPRVAYEAYLTAAAESPEVTKGCRVDWTVLAALGKVESDHGRVNGGRRLAADGTVTPAIIGPPLDGTSGTQAIEDTDDGTLDGDTRWDHAVGPMQFIPTTWRELGRDANHDGVKDPNNLYDAALTAAAHLCLREPGDYAKRAELRRALIAYNQSERYADEVLDWVDAYRSTPVDALVLASP